MRVLSASRSQGAGGGVASPPRARPRGRPRPLPEGWPPAEELDDGGDGGDAGGGSGEGGGGGGGGRYDPWDGHPRPGSPELALVLALVCISVLFLVFLGLALLVWKTAPVWPPPGAPDPPAGLWMSTLLLLGCSVALARALVSHRRHERTAVRRAAYAALGLGASFLAAQALLWRGFAVEGVSTSNGYVALFYALTGLHAVHIAGGIIFLGRALTVLHAAEDGLGRETTLRLCGVYWHVMGVIWIALFAILYLLR